MRIGDVDAGRQLLQILDAVHPLGFQGLAAEARSSWASAFDAWALGTPPGGDRDSFQLATGAFALAGRRGCFGGLGRRPTAATGH